MRLRSFLPALVLGAGLACPMQASPAAAADPPENDLVVVANQDASRTCNVGWTTAYDQHVVLANPITGAFEKDLGIPLGITGVLNEAKPFADNNKIVALWGPSGGGRGGVGVYDLKLNKWSASFPLPADFGGGNGVAHSVTWLPGDKYAVAQTGTIGTSPQWGYVVLFDQAGTRVQDPIPMTGVHGIEWDGANTVYAVGDSHVVKYSYEGSVLSERDSWLLPAAANGTRGGHDLRRRRTDSTYYVTTNGAAWRFDPSITDDAAAFTEVRRFTSTPLSGVKSMDQRFDGRTAYSLIPNPMFYFLDPGGEKAAGFCMKPYKVRWLYGLDQPTYRESAAATTPATPAREPFLWERKKVVRNATPLDVSGQVWVGKGANNWTAESAGKKITDSYNNTGADVLYVKFYFFGDSGSPRIYEAHTAGYQDWEDWKAQARAIAKAIAGRQAYVVIEPEWDANPRTVCDTNAYRKALLGVIGEFNTYADQAVLINSMGLWKDDSVYKCMSSTDAVRYPGTTNLHTKFDAHGLLTHFVSSNYDCTLRHEDHFKYDEEPNYTGGMSYQTARDWIAGLDKDNSTHPVLKRNFPRLRRLLGAKAVYLTDVAITDCGWGDSGQKTLFEDISTRLVPHYESQGLRGASFRSGGPGDTERYMGIENEGGFKYSDNTGVTTAISNGLAAMQTHVNGQQPADPPDFTSNVTLPATAKAGSSITIQVALSNTGGPLTDGLVDLEIYGPDGTRVTPGGQKIWEHEDIPAGSNASFQHPWTVPATTGTYRVKVGVFSADWTSRYHWNDTAGSFVVDATGGPAFTSSASASPAVVAPDGTTTLTATVTNTGTAVTGSTVTVYVTAPDSRVASTWTYTGQDVPAGTSRTYNPVFTAPAQGGTYDIGVSVAAAGGTPGYHDNPDAGSLTVSTSKFTSSATATRTAVMPGGASTVTASVTNTGTSALTSGIVDLYLYDDAGQYVRRQTFTGESIAVGATKTYPWAVTMPTVEGGYVVKVGVFTGDWTTQHWNNAALAMSVAPPSFTISATTTPASVQPGGPLTIGTSVTNVGGHLDGAVVDVEVFNASGVRVTGGQKFWSGQSLGYGDTKSYSWPWTAPTASGTYTVKVGVFATSGTTWTTRYAWADKADTFTVAAPAFVSGADVSSASVAPGGTVTITGTFENVGGSMTNGITDIEVWNPAGTRDNRLTFSGQSIKHGDTAEYTYTWTAPATPGTYTVKLAVFHSTWTPTYHWNNAAATITVGGTTWQPSFRVGNGANTWWIEIYTSSDVTGVDAIADGGRFYLPLTKRSWGAWAATAPSELAAGKPIELVARRSSDGASAASSSFSWLTSSPTTVPGWACSITRGANSTSTWVEAVACATPTVVEVKAGTGAWTALAYSAASGKWGKAMNVSAGTKVVFRARRADNAWAYSTVYTWLS